MGNQNYATQDFAQAIKIDPEFSMSFFHLGNSLLRQRDVRNALIEFNKAWDLADESEKPKIDDGLGQCYHHTEQYDLAIENFNKAIKA